jgi:hypothetical protein
VESLLLSIHLQVLIFRIVKIITGSREFLTLTKSICIIDSLALMLLLLLSWILFLSLRPPICFFETSSLLKPIFEVPILSHVRSPSVDLLAPLTLILADDIYCFVGLPIEVLEGLPKVIEFRAVDSRSLVVALAHLEVEFLLRAFPLVFSKLLLVHRRSLL